MPGSGNPGDLEARMIEPKGIALCNPRAAFYALINTEERGQGRTTTDGWYSCRPFLVFHNQEMSE